MRFDLAKRCPLAHIWLRKRLKLISFAYLLSLTIELPDRILTEMALRWGVCGAGKITHDFVIGVKTCPESDHEVVGIASRSTESASKFAELHSIGRFYGSYEDMAKDNEVLSLYSSRSN